MAKEKFERKNIPGSRIEEIAENGNPPKASTISAVGMALKSFEELETKKNTSKKKMNSRITFGATVEKEYLSSPL